MNLVAIVLLLFSARAQGGEGLVNGIYQRSADASAWLVKTQDGREVGLGETAALEIQKSELSSQDNANTRFYLSLTIPFDEELGTSSYVLVVDGTVYQQSGSGSSHKDTSSLSFYISGESSAKQVSKYLATPLIYRRHPSHNLLVSFSPTKQEFAIGEEVTATLRITNVGTQPICFMKGGRNRAARDNQYVFAARQRGKQVHDIGTSYHFGGLATRQVLKGGDVFEDTINLDKWFSFDEAGLYEILGSYYLNFVEPETNSWRSIWEDYVSAEFLVRIKKPEGASNQ